MKALEVLLWTSGVSLLLIYSLVLGWSELDRRSSVQAFAVERLTDQPPEHSAHSAPSAELPVDEGEQAASASGLPKARDQSPAAEVLAVLRIPGIKLEVPVYHGTGEDVLRRGAGWIDATTQPGSDGNVAIAAHRDRHFRGLKDVALGDLIELDTRTGTRAYRITDLSVVEPTDIHVLAETGESLLTLVTCYPFFHVGPAPQRFIVQAAASDSGT